MIELAQSMKAMIKEGGRYPLILKNQTLGTIFQQVSTRTPHLLRDGHDRLRAAMRSSSPRHHPARRPRDSEDTAARVMACLVDIPRARREPPSRRGEPGEAPAAPVINGMSDFNHPI